LIWWTVLELANGPRSLSNLSDTEWIALMVRGAFLGLLVASDAMLVSGFYFDFFLFIGILFFVYNLRANTATKKDT
jgi:hypothetical protein